MRPAKDFSIIQLSNSRAEKIVDKKFLQKKSASVYNRTWTELQGYVTINKDKFSYIHVASDGLSRYTKFEETTIKREMISLI